MPQPPMPDYDEESHRSREPIPPQNKRGIRTLAIILAIVILFVGGVFAGYVVGHRGGWSTKEDTPTDLPTSSTAGSINADGSGSASSFDIQTGTKDGEALTYEAIAATTNTAVGTVKSRLNRARQKIAKSLADGNNPPTLTSKKVKGGHIHA